MSKGFGRVQKHRQKLEARKDFLRKLNQVIPWDEFCRCLAQLSTPPRSSKAGRKPVDLLLLFKLLILQQLYNLRDEDLECQTHDRESFRRLAIVAEVEIVVVEAAEVDSRYLVYITVCSISLNFTRLNLELKKKLRSR